MSTIICPNCSAQVEDEATFCDNCGSPMMPSASSAGSGGAQRRCPQCGNSVLATDAFCSNCGVSLKDVPAEVVQEAQIVLSVPFSPLSCPNCQATVQPGDRFCDNCGHELEPASGFPVNPQAPAQESAEPASPRPRLLVQPAGIELNLPADKDAYVIGREDPASGSYPEVDLVPHGGEEGGVSRRHAQITRSGQDYFIEDLNSVNYTFVNRQKIPAGEPHPLRDGDEIRLGRVLLRFKTS
jgi:DNA-directed RNA polymerase subunit M/transcription elongation factor TFIIS